MNLNKLRRILKEVLIRSCNSDQIAYIGREADLHFNLKEVSGFGEHVVIPKQVAADTIINYFKTEYQILNFISTLYYYEGKGISGGVVVLRDKHKLDKFLEEHNLIYDASLNKFVTSQIDNKQKDWGILEEDTEYRLAFMELDIISSSELIKTNVKIDVEKTLRNFYDFILKIVEIYNGRIWQWYGDGGLITFLNAMGVSSAIKVALQILYQLPIFNLTLNQLRWENKISLRVAIHFGKAIYKEDMNMIDSEDIQFTKQLEHNLGLPNQVIISETAYNLSEMELRKFFYKYQQYKNMYVYKTHIV